ncbi:zinc finger, CCHC-type containing protein [Tanacetum coccineum]
MADSVKDMTTKFGKLDKFEGSDFRRWQKKMHFLLTTLKVAYVLSTPRPEFVEEETLEQTRKRYKWDNDDYICRGHILNEETLRMEESGKGKGKDIVGSSSVNMVEDDKHKKNNKNSKGNKRKFHEKKNDSNKKSKMACWKCGKPGYFKKDCRVKKNNCDDEITWWIDSNATCHACKDRCWFDTFHPIEDRFVLHMGDESTKPILGRGNVVIEFNSGKTITLFNVVYVSGLRKNLMFGPVLNKCGYKQVYESDKYILSRHDVFIGFGYYNNDMFMLNLNKVPSSINSVYMAYSHVVDSKLWHARLGHVHYQRLHDVSKDSLIPLFDKNMEKCNTRMLTKITRQPFKDIKRNSALLELIHSDLCDFHATPSIGNKKYVVTYIVDASRFCYVYLLHAKDEALDKFKIYKTEVELQQNSLIKTLRTDKGGEYYDPSYFQSVGIIHQTTAPYTPQQNGVSERKNRALKEMVNSMLSYSGLSEGFWGEAMLTACYLLNWGCRAVVRLPEPKKKNLGEKGIDCIFIGYAEHSKAYRFYDPKEHTIVSSSLMELKRWRDLPGINEMKIASQYSYMLKYRSGSKDFEKAMKSRDIVDIFGSYSQFSNPSNGCQNNILNGDLEEEIYKKQPEGFVMPDKCVYCKFDESGKGVIICLYLDDMLIFGTDQNQVDKTKEFLSSNFSMKDMGEADVILGIRIKRENKGLSQIYNGKSRHLGVRHNMVRELIMNGMIYVDFVRSQQNLADHLTKGLAKDLVHKSAIGMGLKCKTKRTTYVSMECRRIKKLGLGFLYAHEGYGHKAL